MDRGARIAIAFILNFLLYGIGFIFSGVIHWRRSVGKALFVLGVVVTAVGILISINFLGGLSGLGAREIIARAQDLLAVSTVTGLVAGIFGALAEYALSKPDKSQEQARR